MLIGNHWYWFGLVSKIKKKISFQSGLETGSVGWKLKSARDGNFRKLFPSLALFSFRPALPVSVSPRKLKFFWLWKLIQASSNGFQWTFLITSCFLQANSHIGQQFFYSTLCHNVLGNKTKVLFTKSGSIILVSPYVCHGEWLKNWALYSLAPCALLWSRIFFPSLAPFCSRAMPGYM